MVKKIKKASKKKKPQQICELCGDAITNRCETHEIDQLASDYFALDTGTILHERCFIDSKPPSYEKRLRELEEEDYKEWWNF